MIGVASVGWIGEKDMRAHGWWLSCVAMAESCDACVVTRRDMSSRPEYVCCAGRDGLRLGMDSIHGPGNGEMMCERKWLRPLGCEPL